MMMMIMMMMTAAIVRVHPVISSRKDGLKYKSLRFCSKDSNDGELLVDSRSNAVRDLGDRECTIVNHVVNAKSVQEMLVLRAKHAQAGRCTLLPVMLF